MAQRPAPETQRYKGSSPWLADGLPESSHTQSVIFVPRATLAICSWDKDTNRLHLNHYLFKSSHILKHMRVRASPACECSGDIAQLCHSLPCLGHC